MKTVGMRQPGSHTALITLTAINLLNFADRYVPSAVKALIQDDLHLSDFQTSLPSTGMVIVYTIFAIIFGMISDKQYFDRRIILCGAIIFWSLATSLAGLASNLTQLVLLRSLVGVGEAAYGTIAPPMLSDFYPVNERNIMYGIYYLAVPVGGALGFIIGAGVGSAYGWRVAFYACGAPGLFVAVMVLKLKNPPSGINDICQEKLHDNDDNFNQNNNNKYSKTPNEYDNNIDINHSIDDSNSDKSLIVHTHISSTSSQPSSTSDSFITYEDNSNDNNDKNFIKNPLHNSISDIENENINNSKRDKNLNDDNENTKNDNEIKINNRNHNIEIQLTCNNDNDNKNHFYSNMRHKIRVEGYIMIGEMLEILLNPHFFFALLGSAANSFSGGGLADWYPTYLLRYISRSFMYFESCLIGWV
jgi:hypothetical protein